MSNFKNTFKAPNVLNFGWGVHWRHKAPSGSPFGLQFRPPNGPVGGPL